MKRIIFYGVAMAAGATLLTWIRYRHVVQFFTTEIYVGMVAVLFTGLGLWVGHRVTRPAEPPPGQRNDKALEALGISAREYEVLELLAQGLSNKEIAKRLFVSPNTIKTHLARLYEKLEVSRRTQAIHKARALRLIE
jgi:DNA-binding CsgD family transcriptional regulator